MDYIKELLISFDMPENLAATLSVIIAIILIALLCVVANFITKKIILRLVAHVIKKNNSKWGKIFAERKVLHNLSQIVPAIIIYYFAPAFPRFTIWIEKIALFYIFAVIMLFLNALLNAANDIYQEFEVSKTRPIKGLTQVLKIIIFIVGGIALISILIDQNPLVVIGGLGALSAVLLLIFKDSILGFVAGIQLASNDMIRVGDWIEMPKYNADGDVIDIALNTVKVRNWDKTITTVPSYAFISDSFKNWRGMHEAGGRRIMRAVYIDTTSIQFCSDEMLERFKKIHYLTDYIIAKEKEIEQYNVEH
ncbi:MAG: mechanosensitive ion channel, partial [Clostridiales bacterium]|nr:mechanosensitive ion channel [Clostridiales bacterium]